MAKIKRGSFLNEVSGKIGGMVVRQTKGPKILAALGGRYKDSPKQKLSNERFRRATRFAKIVLTQPQLKEQYARRITSELTSAYTVAVADAMNPPKIHYIRTKLYTGAIGSLITIKATDDFRVEKVDVYIFSSDGKHLEAGPALRNPRKPFMWNYRATVENPKVIGCRIMVSARDIPNNQTKAEIVIGEK